MIKKKSSDKKPAKPNKLVSLYEMECAISDLFEYRRCVIVPNISWGFKIHECDMLVIRQTSYAVEIEIKRSISDLKADFKKKHDHSDDRIKEFYYAVPEELLEASTELIPEHAGIISIEYFRKKYRAVIIRKAKINKARRLTVEEVLRISHLGTMRIWSLKKKLIKLQK